MSEMFQNFNMVFTKMINEFKPLYAIAWYDMDTFMGLTGIVADNYNEIKEIYDEKYTWKPNQMGVTEYNYRIVEISMKEVEENEKNN